MTQQEIESRDIVQEDKIIRYKKYLLWSLVAFALSIMVIYYMPIGFTTVMTIGSSGMAAYSSWVLVKSKWYWGVITGILSTIIFLVLMGSFLYGLYLGFILY